MIKTKEIEKYIETAKISNEIFNTKVENIKLNNMIEKLKNDNIKIPKAKELIEEYQTALSKKDEEIASLKENNEYLSQSIDKIPKIIRKVFIKDFDVKLLK